MVLRSSELQPRLAPWVESLNGTTSETPGLIPRQVPAEYCRESNISYSQLQGLVALLLGVIDGQTDTFSCS